MSADRKKTIIFGCGLGGKRALASLESDTEPIAFADNDPDKRGQSFQGLPVISPQDLQKFDFDEILVASQYFEDICQQLVDLGIPESKIELLPLEILYGQTQILSLLKKSILRKLQSCYLTIAHLLSATHAKCSITKAKIEKRP